eukprot:s3308_g8.t1
MQIIAQSEEMQGELRVAPSKGTRVAFEGPLCLGRNPAWKDRGARCWLHAVRVARSVVAESAFLPAPKVVATGLGNRKVRATKMNADSSRSHLMLIISMDVIDKETGRRRSGKISIVDLAGSERLSKSEVTGEAQKEAIEINKSLTALGDVMMAFASRAKLIPYRNHKLTQLMQDFLGGSAKTLMFVNISPSSSNTDETINSLKYASRARCIENEVKTNMPGLKSTGR